MGMGLGESESGRARVIKIRSSYACIFSIYLDRLSCVALAIYKQVLM